MLFTLLQWSPPPPPPECAAPCCNRETPKASTPRKKQQESELDCSFISGISEVVNNRDSSYETFAVEDTHEDQSDTDSESEGSPVEDMKYIVFNDALKQLFQKCQGDRACAVPVVELHQKHRGSMVIVQGTCLNNHEFTWRSQPVTRRVAVGNLLLASSVLYTGNTYSTLAEICETMNIKIFSESRFYALQKLYMFPSVNKMWKSHQEQVLLGYVGKPDLVLAGDGRCDSPGHSATFGTYSLMDVDTNLILASNVVKVTEVKNSNNMENEGLIRSLADLEHADVSVSTLATDRHAQITKTMRTVYPHISHQYDVWHLGKSLGKKLTKAANRKECAELQPWVQSIKNHLWWCADTCDGDVTQLKERWMSILRHIVNKHEWHVANVYTKCDHEILTPDEERSKGWLKPGTPSHKALQVIVCDKRLMKDIESITEFCHTGDLEVFHNVLLKYVPKRLAFSYEGTVARTLLAAMDNNMNISRKQAETKGGDKRYKLHWSKGSQDFVVRKVKDLTVFTFREELMEATLSRLIQGTDSKDGAIPVPEHAMRTIGKKDKPNKLEAIQNHVTRFRSS